MRKIKRILALLLSLVFLFAPVPVTSAEETAEAQNEVISAESTVSASEAVTRVQEIEFLREKNSETYLMSDGKFECVVYADNKYYMDANEELTIPTMEGKHLMLSTCYPFRYSGAAPQKIMIAAKIKMD